ncbi:MAG: flippase-like domain-containing protein [Gemmatimonadaceae bacterium]|nr:flippase-like domain-containing protein [Gemmatimonadaceae bacterium]
MEAAASVSLIGWRRPAVVLGALVIVTWVVLPRLFKVNPVAPLRSLQWTWVLVAVMAQVGMQWGRGLLVRGITSGPSALLGHVRATMVVLGASSVGLLGGGFPGYAAALYRWSRSNGVPVAAAAMAGWVPSLLFSAAVSMIAVVSGAMVLTTGLLSSREEAGIALGLLLVVAPLATVGWVVRDRARAERWLTAGARRWAGLRRRAFDDEASRLLSTRIESAWLAMQQRGWWSLVFAALFSACCDALSVWALLAAAGQHLSFVATCAAWGIPHLLGNASMLPGGAGVVELTMTPLLTRLGVSAAPALAVVLGYRALSFWVPMLAGLPVILWFERKK